MITPVEIKNKSFKTGIGYDKREVEFFMNELALSFEEIYKSNIELKEKLSSVEELLNYYKELEVSLQKAIVLAQQASDNIQEAARNKAESIIELAETKSNELLMDSRKELSENNLKISNLATKYEMYKTQYTHLINSQLEFFNSLSKVEITDKDNDQTEVFDEDEQIKRI